MSIKGFSVGGNVERYDYNALDNIPSEITIDTALSDSSTNPVQNKVVTGAINATTDSVTALSGEVSDLKSAFDAVTVIDVSPNLYNPAEKISGEILKEDGTTRTESIYSTTGFMDVSNNVGDTLYFAYGGYPTGVAAPAYGYAFYGDDKSTVVESSIGTWKRNAVVPTDAYYMRLSIASSVMNSYFNVTTDSTLKYVEYYDTTISLINDEQVNTNTENINRLLNPVFAKYRTSYIKLPIVSGVRSDIYYQGITFGNSNNLAAFASGNLTVNKHSISYTPSDSSDVEYCNVNFYSDTLKKANANTINVKVIPSNMGSGSTPKILLIGDSHTQIGQYQYFANSYLNNNSITPTWLGSRTSSNGLNNEGRSGWRAYTYTHFSSTTSSDGEGEATSNPFWNPSTNSFDFSYYMAQQNYSSVDIVFINLGTNDFARGNHNDISEVTSYWQEIITSIHSYNSNIKIVLWMGTPPCDRNGIKGDQWLYRYRSYSVVTNFRGSSWGHDNIFILPTIIAVDPIYDFPFTEVHPNATSTENVIVATDTVHLSETGYAHLAYTISGMIQYICSL